MMTVYGCDLRAEIEQAEQMSIPSECLRAKKLSIQLRQLLQSSSNKERMLNAISGLVQWLADYQHTKEQKENGFDLAA